MRARTRKLRRRRSSGRLVLPKNLQGSRRSISSKAKVKLALGGLLAAMVLINLYVFVWSKRSFFRVRKQAALSAMPSSSGRHARLRKSGKSLADLRIPDKLMGRKKGQASSDPMDEESRVLSGRLRRGDSLYSAFQRLGLSRRLADRVVGAMGSVYNFRRARPGQTFVVRVSGDGKTILEFEFRAGARETYLVERRGDRLVARKMVKPLERRLVLLGLKTKNALYPTLQAAGEKPLLAMYVVRALSFDVNFYSDMHKGDGLRILVEKKYLDGRFYRYGRLLAVRYDGRKGRVAALWYQDRKGRTGYFDPRGRSLRRNLIKTPLKYTKITSPFNLHRFHPVLHRYKQHLGVDLAAPSGTPVWAAADGVVEFAARNRAAGNMVVINHEGGLVTVYMHLLRFARGIRKGVSVRQRQVIGYVGATGRATGPHLHFGLKVNGSYVDPMKFQPIRAPGIPRVEMPLFQRVSDPISGALAALSVGDHPVVRPAPKSVLDAVSLLDRRRPASRRLRARGSAASKKKGSGGSVFRRKGGRKGVRKAGPGRRSRPVRGKRTRRRSVRR